MLKSLSIKNFVIIEQLDLNLHKGFNCLSGETGSGKSLIFNALMFALGDKPAISPIGPFDDKTSVQLSLCLNQKDLIIKREIFSHGISQISMNDKRISIKALKALMKPYISILKQNSNHLLIGETVLDCLDQYAHIQTKPYHDLYQTYLKDFRQYNQTLKKKDAYQNLEQNILEFETLKVLNPSKDEYNTLMNRLKEITTLQEDQVHLKTISELLKQSSMHHDLNKLQVEVLNMNHMQIQETMNDLQSIYHEFVSQIQSLQSANSYQVEIDKIEKRLQEYQKLIPTYRNFNNLIDRYLNLETFIQEAQSFDEDIDNLKNKMIQSETRLNIEAEQVSIKRHQAIKPFLKQIRYHLKDLYLENVDMEISHTKIAYNAKGHDHFDLLVNFNLQDNRTALELTASGGEMSRFNLALMMTLAQASSEHLYIFDEIDSGVSGKVARSIATAMKTLSTQQQVLAITHQAPIAAYADYHVKISKSIDDTLMKTQAHLLNETQRIEELAMMMAGSISEESTNLAQQLREQGGV